MASLSSELAGQVAAASCWNELSKGGIGGAIWRNRHFPKEGSMKG